MKLHVKYLFYLFVFIGFSSVKADSYEDFFSAIDSDRPRVIQSLLQRGFDPNTVNENGHYGLMLAIAAESWEVAKVLVSHPATDVNVRNSADETPLMLAALKGNLELCTLLIERDADVNKKGWAPLHYAATSGGRPVVRLLLDHFAYIDAESPNKTTPLMMAALYGTMDSVNTLIEAGADLSVKNSLGLTALDFANRSNRPEVVEAIAAGIRAATPKGSW